MTPSRLLPEVSIIAGAGIVPGTRTLIVFGMAPRIYMTSRDHDAPVWVWQVG